MSEEWEIVEKSDKEKKADEALCNLMDESMKIHWPRSKFLHNLKYKILGFKYKLIRFKYKFLEIRDKIYHLFSF